MIISTKTLLKKMPKWDVCIVGTGPAGLSLALSLAEKNKTVLLIESGNLKPDQKSSRLNEGEGSLKYQGQNYSMNKWFTQSRYRGFGGGSQIWDGHVSEFIPSELDQWPIKYKELKPYYLSAKKILEIQSPLDAQENNILAIQNYQQKAKRFGDDLIERVKNSKTIDLVLDLTATKIIVDPESKKIKEFVCLTKNVSVLPIRINQLVLAAGAIENARILLQSKPSLKKLMGKSFDWIGKNFSEHIQFNNYDFLLNTKSDFKVKKSVTINESSPFQVFNKSGVIWHLQPAKETSSTTLEKAIEDLNFLGEKKKYSVFSILEHSINRNSSITLSDKTDAFGNPLPKLNWEINDEQMTLWKNNITEIAKATLSSGHGRSRINLENIDLAAAKAHHPAGTTKMSVDENQGVVDKNLKVHGIKNLYIAGSSVFPTSGATNPTLTIMALSIRLAEYLEGQNE